MRDLRRLPSHGAQVRQRQYIGKLMRDIDPEPVLAKLAERKRRHDSGNPPIPTDRALARPAAAEAGGPSTSCAAPIRMWTGRRC